MFKKIYFVQAPNMMTWEAKKLNNREVEELRSQGYIVER